MSPILVVLCYGSATLLAIYALWRFGVKHWYWHVLSLVAAFGIGLAPTPEQFNGPGWTLVVGWFFFLFFIWGIGAPIVAAVQHPPDYHFKHR
jgi:hypothetical protein